jgi:protein transport protein SEC31
MQRVKAKAPASFKAQVLDTEKRLNILFDHLNNDELLTADTVRSMDELARALQARNYEVAQGIHLEILTNKTSECGQWMVSSCEQCMKSIWKPGAD